MKEERKGDCRFTLVISILCLSVTVGGILLFLYGFRPSDSKPWFLTVAFLLIGFPWVFWLLTYMYVCLKFCVRRHRLEDQQIPRRRLNARTNTTASSSQNANERNESVHEPSQTSSNDDDDAAAAAAAATAKRVHFGGAVVHEGESSSQGQGGKAPERQDSSITSSKEIEMPLNSSLSSG